MQHKWEEHEKCFNGPYCAVCDGGLARCTVCWSLEGALTTHCPGVSLSMEMIDIVYAGQMDFRNGIWIVDASPHSPAAIRQSIA